MTEDQILAQEIAKLQGLQGEDVDTSPILEALEEPFPNEAMTVDSSRGFALTSIKPQYLIERLNHVIGLGNWSHGGEYETVEGGVIFKGAIVATIGGKQVRQFAVGFGKTGKNVGDTYKSAKTDSLSKCVSYLGVGNDVFKGLVSAESLRKGGSPAVKKTTKKVASKKASSKKKTTKKVTTSNGAAASNGSGESSLVDEWGF